MNPVIPTRIKLERVVEKFDRSWHMGQPQAIGEVVDSVEFGQLNANQREDLLAELVMIDQEYRWRELTTRGNDHISTSATRNSPDGPLVEVYLEQYAELESEHTLLRLVANEYRVRWIWGVQPKATDFVDRFGPRISSSRLLDSMREIDDQLSESSEHIDVRTRCPYCHRRVSTATEKLNAVICNWCEQSFSLVNPDVNSDHPQWIAHFELLERIGSGSFGTVWKARDTELERIVAIKFPHHGMVTSVESDRFVREARATAQLRHPNIVTVHEIGCGQDGVYIVSEFVQGMTLADYLKVHVCTADEAVQLCVTLATTLEHAHQAGVIHRDLKPANIMLDDAKRPYIMDFGLAKWDGADITVSLDGKVLGTPAYMSPEQAAGCVGQADRRSDVYSLGVILYQLLTDTLPFDGDTHTVLHRVMHDEPPRPQRLNRNIPRDLEAVCLKSLAKRPVDRYQTAGEMALDLRRILTGQPVHARTVTAAARVWKWCRRNPVLSALVTALSLSIVIGIAGMTAMWRSAVAEAENARTARDMQQLQSFELAFDRALRLCQDGEIGLGLLWLVRSLELAPSASTDITNVVRMNIAYWQSQLVSLERFLDIEADVSCAAFGPDGRRVLIGAKNGVASLWEVGSGELIKEFNAKSDNLTSVALGDSIAITASDEEGNSILQIWDLKSGTPVGSPVSGLPRISEPAGLAISPLQSTFVSAHGNEIRLWDLESRELISRMGHVDQVRTVRFCPDGKRILSVSVDHTARLWNADTGMPDGEPIDATAALFAATFNQDGSRFATGADGDVTVWDSASRTPLVHLTGHIGRVRNLTFSPNGDELIANGAGTISIWDLRSKSISQRFTFDCNTVAVSPNATRLLADATDRAPRIWRLPKHAASDRFEHGGPVWGADISRDGKSLVTSGGGGLRVWDIASRHPLSHRELDFTGCVAIGPTDPPIIAASKRGTVLLCAMDSLDGTGTTLWHANWINQMTFSSDGRQILTACFDSNARIWDAESGQLVHKIRHPDKVLAAAFHPDGKSCVTACEDGVARLWTTSTAKQIGRDMRHSAGLLDVAMSADGSLVATATADGKAVVWDVRTQEQVGRPFHHDVRVRSITFSPDVKYVATGCEDGTVRYWHIATGMPLVLSQRHTQKVYDLKWSSHGTIVTGSIDGTARLWPRPPKPVQGDIERVRTQIELATGLSLDAKGEFVVLDSRRWQLLRRNEGGGDHL